MKLFSPSIRVTRTSLRSNKTDYQVLEPRRMLANLAITNVFASNPANLEVPVVGQQVQLSTVYETDGLAADASYAIEVRVNGFLLDTQGKALGAGETIGSYLHSEAGWWAQPGVNVAEVWIDANDEVAETDESDNYIKIEFTPDDPNLDTTFAWPFGGEAGKDYVVVTYPDVDPSNGLVDHMGYNNGHAVPYFSVSPSTNQVIDLGIPIFALADAVVERIEEGNMDRYTTNTYVNANSVTLNHIGGGDFESFYTGIRRDSIAVKAGDTVQRGDFLGFIAGRTGARHAQTSVLLYKEGQSLNPFVAPEIYWESQPVYPHHKSTVATSWVSNVGWGFQQFDGPSEFRTLHNTDSSQVLIGARVLGLEKDEAVEFKWYTPSGTLFFEDSDKQPYTRLSDVVASFTRLPNDPEIGTWTIEIIADGEVQKTESFEVTEEVFAEMRVEELNTFDTSGHSLTTANRYSPYDLGASQLDSAPSKEIPFRVTNHGTDTLYLHLIDVTEGFFVSESEGESMLFPGETTTFNVYLDTSYAGYRLGEVTIHTNDPDESEFKFSIEGAVLDAGSQFDPDYFTIGMIERSLVEGNSLMANVRIPENASADMVVDLKYSAPTMSGPSSVIIPLGKQQVSFEVSVEDDLNPDMIDRIGTITATLQVADAPNVGTYALRIEDSGNGLSGTDGDDIVALTLSDQITLTINDVDHDISGDRDRFYEFDALGGKDQIRITDRRGGDAYTLRADKFEILGDFGFEGVNFEKVELISVPGEAQGFDQVDLYGVDGEDTSFEANNKVETLIGGGRDFRVTGFAKTKAFVGESGYSIGVFYDTPAKETFYVTPELTYFGREDKIVTTRGFDRSDAFSTNGGDDVALIYGAETDDTVFVDQAVASVVGTNAAGTPFSINANQFPRTTIRTLGGNDTATLMGSEVEENFYSSSNYATMGSETRFSRVDLIDELKLVAGGENDRVILQDSAGDDTFFARPSVAILSNSEQNVRAEDFGYVIAIASEGFDRATLWDSAQDGDRFTSRPNASWLFGTGFFNHVITFEQVFAESVGGNDKAIMFGSELDDRINGSSVSARISGNGFFTSAAGFNSVSIELWQGGNDIAILNDSEDDDSLVASVSSASIFTDQYSISLVGMDRVVAVSDKGGFDSIFEGDELLFELLKTGNWN